MKSGVYISIIALIISITAVLISIINGSQLKTDTASILVTVLALLVTVLIGWQIYNTLDFEKRIKRAIEEQVLLITKENYKYRSEAIGTALFNIGEAMLRLKDYTSAFNLYIKAVTELNNENPDSEEVLLCFDRIDLILSELSKGDYKIKMPKYEQEKYLEMLTTIKSNRKNRALKFLLSFS